ncbi:glycosyl hydrolase family 18 protein [Deinococcus hopiensis]|uniref:Cellulose binding domain-containing protein n=1 Tax=Deinococcus hopiensis KR-140 TaxID=695939 RepID=A0A1W1VW55_9DEIO|nr:glycosyl hydrolase family 18 protein [Deinococcus hopiensis]SMB97566.1 Cellulose binding domain-containing protein [Deinococcus hopiensis KR-140]
MSKTHLGLGSLLLTALVSCGQQAAPSRTLTPQATNRVPTITAFSASKTTGPAPLDTTLTLQASDPDGDTLSCVLDINGDGYGDLNYGSCVSPKTQPYTFKQAGITKVRLMVTDARGATTAREIAITVGGAVPSPSPNPDPTPTPPTQAAFDVTYKVDSDWKSGFVATVTVKNNGPAVDGWTLGWSFDGDQRITGGWNGTPTQSGKAVTVKNASYNGNIPSGGTVSFGFMGEYPYGTSNPLPSVFTVNGVKVGEPAPPPPPPPPPLPAPSGNTWVMGYYVGYLRGLYPLDAVNWSALTHLMLGRVTPNSDGTLNTTFDIDTVNGPLWAKAAVQRAHANNRKVILMLGGAGTYGDFVGAANSANRARFIDNLLKLVDEYGADGLDLDWEPIQTGDEASLKALAEGLKARRPNLLLTLPVGWVNANFPSWEARPYFGQIAPLFDRINIMSYAMNGVYGGWQSWHSGALAGETGSTPSSVMSSVDAYANVGVPLSKIGLGIGFFGSCFTGVTGPNQSSATMKLVADDNVMSYANIMTQYASAGAKTWDDKAKVPYLSSSSGLGPQKCNFVSYEDPQSITLKGQYARQKGLGGAIVWNINQGYLKDAPVGSRDPLMDAVRAAFLP